MKSWAFDYFYSLAFWAAVVVVAAAFRLLGRWPRLRAGALLAGSSALLLALPHFGALELGLVWALALSTFGVARLLTRPGGGERARRAWAAAGVLGVLAFLAFFKYRFLQDLLLRGGAVAARPSDYFFLLGVSYTSFKVIHVLVEAHRRELKAVDAAAYLNYVTFFPAFISGPINRYPHFAAQLAAEARPALGPDLSRAFERIVHGLFKKLVLVQIVYPYIITQRPGAMSGASVGELAIGLYAYALYTYFDFSAYSDLALGTARLVGIELPENFDWPFLQKNIRELWSHWHISFTGWLVDYVYWPLVRKLRNVPFFRTRPLTLSIVGMNVNFLACGMWHGETFNFILWGAYHGLGISIAQVYQRQKKKIRNRAVQRYFGSRLSRVAGAVLTFHYFVVGLGLFALDLGQLRILWAGLLRGGMP